MTPGGRPHAAARPLSPSAAAADSRGGTDPDEPAMELARFVSAACCGGELDEALAALAGDADACAPLSLPMSSLPLQLARLVLLCPLEAEERLRHVLWRVGALPSPVSQLIIRPTHVRSARAASRRPPAADRAPRAARRKPLSSERLRAAAAQRPMPAGRQAPAGRRSNYRNHFRRRRPVGVGIKGWPGGPRLRDR